MLNANVVNAEAACSLEADFREFFSILGRFLRFKNTVKYTGGFALNHNTVLLVPEAGAAVS
jgi:hypothetical protein